MRVQRTFWPLFLAACFSRWFLDPSVEGRESVPGSPGRGVGGWEGSQGQREGLGAGGEQLLGIQVMTQREALLFA